MTVADHEPDDPPWTEDQWERFMQRSDVRSAKFGELLETLRDHPDRDEIIAREMGWDHRLEDRGATTWPRRHSRASLPKAGMSGIWWIQESRNSEAAYGGHSQGLLQLDLCRGTHLELRRCLRSSND